ncbi:unnamed protein product [Arabis nemorensis]|uniref:Uncharacterized protein n=1 Tax=Arabis nemorensis TaxID=586526 RepID=A0A565ANU2_9BRAS|nr:unnamed protein product [Arabis nemorensis]
MQRDVIHADEKSDWHSVLSQFQAADDDNRDGPQMADLHSVMSQLQSSVTQLQSSVAALTTTINESLAKVEDPLEKVLEKLIKDRDELSRLVLVIASLSSVSTFFIPPGGLDSNGHIRFRDTLLFRLYHVFAGLTFAVSFANLSFLHKPLEEQKEKALKGLRKRMNIAGIFLWVATVFFFIAFVLGF